MSVEIIKVSNGYFVRNYSPAYAQCAEVSEKHAVVETTDLLESVVASRLGHAVLAVGSWLREKDESIELESADSGGGIRA